jgi:hypothetical protein
MDPTHATPETTDDRRELPRQAQEAGATLRCPTARPRPRTLPDEAEFCPHDSRPATAVNSSRRGVGFIADRPLPEGAYQKVRLEGEAKEREVQVRRCDPLPDGRYAVGATYC